MSEKIKSKVIAISISTEKGVPKTNIEEAFLVEQHGIKGDAHAGNWHRQVSFLAIESINKMKEKMPELTPGAFAENITTEGLDLISLPLNARLMIGDKVLLEISQKGKECIKPCNIYYTVGDCVMPKEGVFARVIKGGNIKAGDNIKVIND